MHEKLAQVLHPLSGENCMPNKLVRYCGNCGAYVKDQKYCHNCGSKLIWTNIYKESMNCRQRSAARVMLGKREARRKNGE